MDTHAFLGLVVVFLAAAVIAVPLFHRLGLGSVLGFLAAGALLGPSGAGVVTDVKSIFEFGELGILLLLFLIGLELKPSRLWVMRRAVFGLGIIQVALTTGLLAAAGLALGLPGPSALVMGFGLSLSSTAFAVQIMGERKELNTAFGRASFAILLFQDLAAIPALAVMLSLGEQGTGGQVTLGVGAIKALVIVAVFAVGGRYVVRPLFRIVSVARSREVFTAAAFLVVAGAAFVMESAGLSAALGTFLAGVLLADSEYRHEIEADIEPFKGLLMGLFFMAVGMSADFRLLVERPLGILGLVVAFMSLKALVIYGIGRAARFGPDASGQMAAVLAEGGEFAFVLFGAAIASGIMDKPTHDILIMAVTLSMAATPLVVRLQEKRCSRLKTARGEEKFDTPPANSPVIIAGFGRFGQIVGRILRVQDMPFTALEHDSEQVQMVRRFGQDIYFGDASRLDLLQAAGAAKARAFVLCIDDMEASLRTAKAVREHFPELRILARARNRTHALELMKLGISLIFRETLGSSLETARRLLAELGVEEVRAEKIVGMFREHDERILREQLPYLGDEREMINYSKQAAQQLVELFREDKKRD